MEVVGAVASAATLAALAKEICSLSIDLLRGYQSAPKELLRISNQTTLILLELECICRSQKEDGLSESLTKEESWIFQQSLASAKTSLTALSQSCQRYSSDKGRTSSRLVWTLFDRKTAEAYMGHLQRTETSLCVILQVINIRASAKARDENYRQNDDILEHLRTYHDEVQKIRAWNSETASQNDQATSRQTDSLVAFRFLNCMSIPESWRSILNSEILFIRSGNEFQNAYELYARLPFFWFWGRKAFILSTSLRKMRTIWPNFQVLNGSLNICNLVPVESEIVGACRRGDVIAVWDLFGSIKRLRMTSQVMTKVSFGTLLHAASYYRQPQIARLLLHSGADVEVIGDEGFTSPFYLFGYAGQKRTPQTEFLEILVANAFSNFNGRDTSGWSVLHRAATFGTADDVRALIQLRASLQAATNNLHWTPIFCSVCFGNMNTLQELWTQHKDPDLKDAKDLRGWNLLHVAAGAGNFDAIPFLLEKGVNLKAISKATSRSVPPALRNKPVTPSDVARNCGEAAYKKWAEAVREGGQEVDVDPGDIDWGNEDCDGVLGGCECCENWAFKS